MNVVVDILVALCMTFYFMIKNLVLLFVPPSYLYKDVSKDIVLITGAGSGLGRLQAIRFGKLGSKLVLWDVNREGNEETATIVRESGAKAFTYTVDITDKEAVYRASDRVKQDVGVVTILVNNAGIVSGKSFLELTDRQIQKTFDVNIMAHFWTVRAFLPDMITAGKGHIVTVASLAGIFGTNKLTDYCSSKFAAVGFDESLRIELKSSGRQYIKTTCICPYYISTGMFSGVNSKILPILEPRHVAHRIVDGILTNEELVIIPGYFSSFVTLKGLLPTQMLYVIQQCMGGAESMNTFTGRVSGKGNNLNTKDEE